MSSKSNSQKILKIGDKVVVTIENAIQDCVVVSMVFQQRTFCGALMDTTKKNGPHGIPEHFEEPKIETRRSSNEAKLKRSHKPPFPQPLLTRNTYKQNVPQPPLRNIFRRIRRSRRNARVNMVSSSKESAIRNRKNNFQTHNAKCRCHQCLQKKSLFDLAVNKKNEHKSLKRKANDTKKPGPVKKLKEQISVTASSDEDTSKTEAPQTIASPLKHLLPRKSIDCSAPLTHNVPPLQDDVTSLKNDVTSLKNNPPSLSSKDDVTSLKHDATSLKLHKTSLKHTPAIKIKYKSPAGRGRIMNIPSKPHGGRDLTSYTGSDLNTDSSSKPSPKRKFVVAEAKLNLNNKLQMLKRITNVEIQDVPAASGSSSNQRGNQNKFLVVVKHESEKSDRLRSSAPSVNKNKAIQKKITAKSQNKKAVGRPQKSLRKPVKSSTSTQFSSTRCEDVESRHLRIILQPLNSKTGGNNLNVSSKAQSDTSDKQLNNLRSSPNQDSKKVPGNKNTPSPLSHTMYVTTCKDISGIVYAQGDVIWSKLSGYPWWPSRIIKLIVTKTDGEILQQEVMVAWFCSSTTSIIPLSCIQPFEKSFDVRFEKKRKGVYQKAVNEARSALKKMSSEVRKLISQFET